MSGLWRRDGMWLRSWVARGAVLSNVGKFVGNRLVRRARKKWEDAEQERADIILDRLSSYDTACGAGRLLAAWLQFQEAEESLEHWSEVLQGVLVQTDPEDHSAEERAVNRLILSKALFYLEGFKMGHCHYESLQKAAQTELRKNPQWRNIGRHDVFKSKPFPSDFLIGSTHRLLLLLAPPEALPSFLEHFLQSAPLRNDSDYLARLIALTLNEPEAPLAPIMLQWFSEYRDFKIEKTHQQENWINTSIAALSGELPAMVGAGLISELWKKRPRK